MFSDANNRPRSSSFPAMGTWIEMMIHTNYNGLATSFPAMGTWIEISCDIVPDTSQLSFPAMGTWIEIVWHDTGRRRSDQVVPCNGNVD